VTEWFEATLESVPRMVDIFSAGRELEAAQAERDRAEAQLVAFVEQADVLDARLFQRGLASRQKTVDAAVEEVRHVIGPPHPDSGRRIVLDALERL
jgi:hypothetical protein